MRGIYIGDDQDLLIGMDEKTYCSFGDLLEYLQTEVLDASVVGLGQDGFWIFDVATFCHYISYNIVNKDGSKNLAKLICFMEYAMMEEIIHSLNVFHKQREIGDEEDWLDFFITQEIDV